MAIILNIDTALETASVCLAREARPVEFLMNETQIDHASWLHPALLNVIAGAQVLLSDIDAIAVTLGPGSYTGLRVGMAAAKGFCLVLQIPLIPVNTLELMAYASLIQDADLFCPMIDARRMEVFMALYDKKMVQVIDPQAMIIDSTSFYPWLSKNKVLFSGSGCQKLKKMISHPNALFSDTITSAANMPQLSEKYFREKKFADITYAEPLYLKEFYTVERK